MKIKMLPHVKEVKGQPNGMSRVIEAYFRTLPKFGIEMVKPDARNYDIKASHAGITGGDCDVAHLHGIYFTNDYNASEWEWRVNARIVDALRHAKEITVPSAWVAETFQRDMRVNPWVIPHGIDCQEWNHNLPSEGYVLWNKNRRVDVCDNSILDPLVRAFPQVQFVSTLTTTVTDRTNTAVWPQNFKILPDGAKTPHAKMKVIVQQAGVYLSTTKETFGIGVLEAMASGVPVLGWNFGGNVQLVKHGVNGYLAEPGNFDDLCEGLNYCLKHRDTLGENGREMAKIWTWEAACEKLVKVYEAAMIGEPAEVGVVIPVYNKSIDQVNRAVNSVKAQTLQPKQIILIDDGSQNELSDQYRQIDGVTYIKQHNAGVAEARNNGISRTDTKYITCLDADDWLGPNFLKACVYELEQDRSLGIAYTSLRTNRNGASTISLWPGKFDANKQLTYPEQNQIPTACVFRREAWARTGGYRSRYCPQGAGEEDAAFWAAICSIGYNAKMVDISERVHNVYTKLKNNLDAKNISRLPTQDELKAAVTPASWEDFESALFEYSAGDGNVHGNREHKFTDWLSFYPWASDKFHPLASMAGAAHYSHPVRQYDEPVVSVIIPVGPGHEKEVTNALDSLEMQHFRKWEVIICNDTGSSLELEAYPYVRIIDAGHRGAGHARNRGVEAARGNLLFYLDADDMLASADALEKMATAFDREQSVIYSDYLGRAVWDYKEASTTLKDRLIDYNPRLSTALFRNKSADFDCALAQRQPEYRRDSKMPYYHWCLISVLVPKAWHIEIGGFDEELPTWEDVDYIWRLAKAGHCFYRLEEELILYNYHKGNRREASAVTDKASLQKHKILIQYITKKYERISNVGCNCGKRKAPKPAVVTGEVVSAMSDREFVLIEFDFPGSGGRSSYGRSLVSPTRQTDSNGKVIEYSGRSRRKGDKFLVHKKDQAARPDMFHIIPDEIRVPKPQKAPLPEPAPVIEMTPEPLPEPVMMALADNGNDDSFDFATIPGINSRAAGAMAHLTADEAKELGVEGLSEIKYVGKATAKKVIDYLG